MQFIDLKAQQDRIREKIDLNIKKVLDHGQFIMGPEILELEERLAVLLGGRAAELLIVGKVIPETGGTTLFAKVVQSRDGEVLFADDVYFEEARDLEHLVAGLVMKIEQRFPTVQGRLIAIEGEEARGSARSAADIDIKAVLDRCAGILIRYGGHAQAAGMTLRARDIDTFRTAFLDALGGDPAGGTDRATRPARHRADHREASRSRASRCPWPGLRRCAPPAGGSQTRRWRWR